MIQREINNIMLPILTLKRVVDHKTIKGASGILGKVYDENHKLLCFSIERPDLNNQRSISCIPEGVYNCSRDESGKHQYDKINAVPDRDFIEIHIANRPDQLNGCIAFGDDGAIMECNIAVRNSKATLDKILERYPDGFTLIILDLTDLI
jgi:hypothetical protein